MALGVCGKSAAPEQDENVHVAMFRELRRGGVAGVAGVQEFRSKSDLAGQAFRSGFFEANGLLRFCNS